MKSVDNVGVTFANLLLARGIFNGIVNVTLGCLLFEPSDDGNKVEPAPTITSRLRMDVACARQLRDALTSIIASVDAETAPPPDTSEMARERDTLN
jgi:hypothetical protein